MKGTPSWGNYPGTKQQAVPLAWRSDNLPGSMSMLPYGRGRSYGDVALNNNGTVITTNNLDHFISFDKATGTVTCEAGVMLADILKLAVPHGWFLPVTPGTKFVSVGGVIANDVHGKNHHRAGTFGRHVLEFELLRSDGSRTVCTPARHLERFNATVGGLGLTGLITYATIQLKKIETPWMNTETIRMGSLNDFMALADESDVTHEYTVAWLDTGTKLRTGRGLFMRANHIPATYPDNTAALASRAYRAPKVTLPFFAPNRLISTPVIKIFNALYRNKRTGEAKTHYDPYFYPLDILQNWNRLYGRRGFQSYQCVVPREGSTAVIQDMLHAMHTDGLASPLTVIKLFGDVPSPGLMSFPRPGINILFDFPNEDRLPRLLSRLDTITAKANGRINPAKDAHISAKLFQQCYPQWKTFARHIDPAFSSSFWRRVSGDV